MSLARLVHKSLLPLAQVPFSRFARSSANTALRQHSHQHHTRTPEALLRSHRQWGQGSFQGRSHGLQSRSFSSSTQVISSFLPTSMLGFLPGTVGYSLALSGAVCLTANVAGFLVATFTKTHKITDLIGVGTFTVSAWATHVAASHAHGVPVVSGFRPFFLTLGVTFWSVRLAGFLFYRILQTGTDKRLDPFYAKADEPWLTGPSKYPLKLGAFWTIQAFWEWLVLLPVTVSQAAAPTAVMGAWGWAGAAAFAFFWAFEAGADFQKDWFKRQPGNKSEFVRTGFYYWCQFPNYFGEISVWWTMYFWAGLPNTAFAYPYILLSPIFTTYLLRYGSGVANLSYYQNKNYGHREDFREYVAKTPVLLPFMKPFYVNNEPAPAPEAEEALVAGNGVEGDEGAGTSSGAGTQS